MSKPKAQFDVNNIDDLFDVVEHFAEQTGQLKIDFRLAVCGQYAPAVAFCDRGVIVLAPRLNADEILEAAWNRASDAGRAVVVSELIRQAAQPSDN